MPGILGAGVTNRVCDGVSYCLKPAHQRQPHHHWRGWPSQCSPLPSSPVSPSTNEPPSVLQFVEVCLLHTQPGMQACQTHGRRAARLVSTRHVNPGREFGVLGPRSLPHSRGSFRRLPSALVLRVLTAGLVCLCPALGHVELHLRFDGGQMWPRAGRILALAPRMLAEGE